MTYGLTDDGFLIKRLTTILEEVKAGIAAGFGADGVTVLTSDESGFGILAGIVSKQLAEVWELAEAVYASQYPGTAAGAAFDNVLALANLRRIAAAPSTVWQLLVGDLNTIVPDGSLAEHESSGARFETQADETLDADDILGAEIEVGGATLAAAYAVTIEGVERSVLAGTYDTDTEIASALAADIDRAFALVAVDQTAKTFAVAFDVQDYFLAGKRCRVTGSTGNDAVYTVVETSYADGQTTVEVSEDIEDATVDGSLHGYVEATSSGSTLTLALHPLPTTATDASEFAASLVVSATGGGTLDITSVSVPHEMAATADGPTEATLGTLTTIATPVSGWVSTTNVLPADEGNLEETDVDGRQRRARSLRVNSLAVRIAALANVDAVKVYDNDSGVEADGRPAHSVECVVTGGDPQDIADTIFAYKAGGVQSYGNTFKLVTDSQGEQHVVYFSRPTEIPIYVDVTVDSLYEEEDLPASPAAAIQQAVVTYGATYTGGMDVLASRLAGAVALAVPGIDALTVKIGIAASPSTSTTISIAADEVATFALARVTVSGV